MKRSRNAFAKHSPMIIVNLKAAHVPTCLAVLQRVCSLNLSMGMVRWHFSLKSSSDRSEDWMACRLTCSVVTLHHNANVNLPLYHLPAQCMCFEWSLYLNTNSLLWGVSVKCGIESSCHTSRETVEHREERVVRGEACVERQNCLFVKITYLGARAVAADSCLLFTSQL